MATRTLTPKSILDNEQVTVEKISRLIQPAFGDCSWNFAANAYICLKSKPLMLITGPAGTGKLAFAQGLARAIAGDETGQRIELLGHPWWAGGTGNVALFTKAHQEFNKEKLLYLIEEAEKTENQDKVFIVCLARISLAEIDLYFEHFASKLQNPYSDNPTFTEALYNVSLPSNLILIGTLDDTRDFGWDDRLAAAVNIVQFPAIRASGTNEMLGSSPSPSQEKAFLSGRIWGETAVCQKLHSILGFGKPGLPLHPFRGLLQIESLIHSYGLSLSRSTFFEVLTYVANAWTQNGNGIFDNSKEKNLAVAMDYAVSQILLARLMGSIQQRRRLKTDLQLFLKGSYPVAFATIPSKRR